MLHCVQSSAIFFVDGLCNASVLLNEIRKNTGLIDIGVIPTRWLAEAYQKALEVTIGAFREAWASTNGTLHSVKL